MPPSRLQHFIHHGVDISKQFGHFIHVRSIWTPHRMIPVLLKIIPLCTNLTHLACSGHSIHGVAPESAPAQLLPLLKSCTRLESLSIALSPSATLPELPFDSLTHLVLHNSHLDWEHARWIDLQDLSRFKNLTHVSLNSDTKKSQSTLWNSHNTLKLLFNFVPWVTVCSVTIDEETMNTSLGTVVNFERLGAYSALTHLSERELRLDSGLFDDRTILARCEWTKKDWKAFVRGDLAAWISKERASSMIPKEWVALSNY